MRDKIAELLKLYGVEANDSLKQQCMRLAEIQELTPDDPFYSIVIGHHIQTYILSNSAPREYKSAADAIIKARDAEIEAYKAEIDKFSNEIKNKMVVDMVPEVAGKVADVATLQITRMNRSIGLERMMIFTGIAALCLLAAVTFGFALGNILNITKFLAQTNSGIYSVNTMIEVAMNRVGAAIFFAGCIVGCFTILLSFLGFMERRKIDISKNGFILIWLVCVIFLAMVFVSGKTYFIDSPHIQVVTRQTSQEAMITAIKNNAIPEALREIIRAGVHMNEVDRDGATPLMVAAANSTNPEIINILVKNGANVNSKNNDGFTPLAIAATKNPNYEIVEELIKSSADVNAKDNNNSTVLILAVSENANPKIISALISAGAELNAMDNSGYTPLLAAVWNDVNVESVTALIKAGAQVNWKHPDNGFTLLIVASAKGVKPEIIKSLIQYGANINAKDKNGTTALMFSAENGNTEIVKILIDSKADIKAKDNRGATALDYVRRGKSANNPQLLKLLELR